MQFKYCPKCGGQLNGIICAKCGFVFYQNSKPTSSAVIIRDGKVLLAKRKIEPKQGFWDLPGGFLESGELPVKGLHREMQEELGIEVEVEKFLDFWMGKYGKEQYDTLNIVFLCGIKSGEPSANDDVEQISWFALGQLPQMAWPGEQELLIRLSHEI